MRLVRIPLGAGLSYAFIRLVVSPELAGALMAISSVSVTLNMLLLKRFRPSVWHEDRRSTDDSGNPQMRLSTVTGDSK